MRLGIDFENRMAIFLVTPEEMRAMADAMEKKLANTKPGDSLTIAIIDATDGFTNEPADFSMKITAMQSEENK